MAKKRKTLKKGKKLAAAKTLSGLLRGPGGRTYLNPQPLPP